MYNTCNTGFGYNRSASTFGSCGSWGNWGNWGVQRICRDCNGNIRVNNACGNACSCNCNCCCNTCGCNNNDSNNSNNQQGSNGGNGTGGFTCVTFCGNGVAQNTSFLNTSDTNSYYTRRSGCGCCRNRSSWNYGYNN